MLGRGNLQTRGNTLARGRSRRYVLLAREYKRPSAVCKGRYNVEFTVNGLGRRALHEHVRIPVLVSAVRTELILRLYLQLHAGKPRPLYAHGYLVALTAVRRGNHYAGKSAQIVELSSSYLTALNDGDCRDFGGMQGESSFYAYAERKSAYGETFSYAAVLFSDYDPFEILYSFLGSFNNLKAYFNGVAHVERGNFLFHSFLFDGFN